MEKLWGNNTQKSLDIYPNLEKDYVNMSLIKSIILIKKSAALSNYNLGILEYEFYFLINEACKVLLKLKHINQYFPLSIWQCGSGTQINMNVNEVIALIANKIRGKNMIDAYNHVNISQSTNDVIPSAIHISIVIDTKNKLLPVLKQLSITLKKKQEEFKHIVKLGRTHLQDAMPLSIKQEISGFKFQIDENIRELKRCAKKLNKLPIGGTCVGTGVNSPLGFDKEIIKNLEFITSFKFNVVSNKFALISSHDDILTYSSILNRIAISMFKISNDLRLLSSGPQGGINEYILPTNERGSSSMPGKINPTQCEMMSIISLKVIGIHQTITLALSHGNLQINLYKLLISNEINNAINLLKNGIEIFTKYCLVNLKCNETTIQINLEKSAILVTRFVPHLGYEKCKEIYSRIIKEKKSIKEIILSENLMSKNKYLKIMDINKLIKPY